MLYTSAYILTAYIHVIAMLHLSYFVAVFNSIESYAPGFKASVVGRDILTPPEIERIFGITGGVCLSLLVQAVCKFFMICTNFASSSL